MIRIKSDKIIVGENLFDGYVYVEGGVITDVTAAKMEANECYDLTGKYLSPGFIDSHTHGGLGVSFYNSSADDVTKACNFHLAHGTTTVFPTVIACAYEEIVRSLEFITEAIENGEIAEMGTAEELLEKKGVYYKLYTLQNEQMKKVIEGR